MVWGWSTEGIGRGFEDRERKPGVGQFYLKLNFIWDFFLLLKNKPLNYIKLCLIKNISLSMAEWVGLVIFSLGQSFFLKERTWV